MTRFFDFDSANARLPDLREALDALREQRNDLIRLRDEALATHASTGGGELSEPSAERPATTDETRILEMRMQGVIDQMQAGVERIDSWGITVRDIDSGLVDFPALVEGRQIWLCWRLGEERVEWWHEMSDGFAGRRRLEDLA